MKKQKKQVGFIEAGKTNWPADYSWHEPTRAPREQRSAAPWEIAVIALLFLLVIIFN